MSDTSPQTSRFRDPVAALSAALVGALVEPLGLSPEDLLDVARALELAPPPNADLGDLSMGCFPLAKRLREAPPRVAEKIARAKPGELGPRMGPYGSGPAPEISSLEAVGPYVNIRFAAGTLEAWLLPVILGGAPPYAGSLPPTGSKVVVEYSGPNTNKPLHLGHVRNNVLGMSLANILEAGGESVVRVNIVNDRGIHICKSMVAYDRWGGGASPSGSGEKPDHFVGRYYALFDQKLKEERGRWEEAGGAGGEDAFLAESRLMEEIRECLRRWEAGEPSSRALWKRMNDWVYEGFHATYARMGCRFDRWYLESETYQRGKAIVEEGLAKGVFYRKEDGSVWARLEPAGLEDKLLLRSDGTSVYITQDLGTAVIRYEDERMDRSLYVVGSEQALHFKNLFATLKRLGYPWADGCRHVSYGLVTLPRGMGKLKSREGRSADADTLLDELHELAFRKIEEAVAEGKLDRDEVGDLSQAAERVGQAALKIYLLQVNSDKNIVYDPDATLAFTGDTGPAIQYSHARIHGILRKAAERGLVSEAGTSDPGPTAGADTTLLTDPNEKDLVARLLAFPRCLETAHRTLAPSPVANYLLDLTKSFARFYHNCPVLRAEPRGLALARLDLSRATAAVLKRGLELLTVEAPDRM